MVSHFSLVFVFQEEKFNQFIFCLKNYKYKKLTFYVIANTVISQ